MSGLFAEFSKVLSIPNSSRILSQIGPLDFLNKFFIPAFYQNIPYSNLEAFNPDSRSHFFKGWAGYCRGTNTYAEKRDDVISSFMSKRGGPCFHRCYFSSLVLTDAAVPNYLGGSIIRRTPVMPHSILFFTGLTADNSLHMSDMGNRIAPILNVINMDFLEESEVAGSPISQSKIVKTDTQKGLKC